MQKGRTRRTCLKVATQQVTKVKFNTKLQRTARCVFGSKGSMGVQRRNRGGTECSSVVLVLVERTQSRIFIKIESSMSRGQHRRRRRRRLRQTASSMRKDSRQAGKTRRQETRRRFKADPSCATHRTSEPFHTSIRAQPQRQFS